MEGPKRSSTRKRRQRDVEMLNIVDLPFGVAVDILSRLPMAALVRCRCVCRTWRNLIADPHFAHTRQGRSATVDVVVSKNKTNFYLVELKADHDYTSRARKTTRFVTPLKFPGQIPQLLGSCNGLVCLCDASSIDSLFICNPILGEYVVLPKPERGEQVVQGLTYMFGFCPTTQQYKVLRFFSEQFRYSAKLKPKSEFLVHTVGTNSWRNLGEIPLYFFERHPSVTLNGALHCLAYDGTTTFIYSFELEKEQVIPIPISSELSNTQNLMDRWELRLGMLGNCLCLFHYDLDKLDIYSMKDYGVPESWTKDHSFTMSIPKLVLLYPITVCKNGDIFMSAWDYSKSCHLVSYNPKINILTIPRIYNMKTAFVEPVTFVPSFLSLKDVAVTESLKIQNVE